MLLTVAGIPADVGIQQKLTSMHVEEWLNEDVFRIRWWFLLVMLAVFACAWWKLADKSLLPEVVLYATLTTIFVMAIVEYGEELTLWDYPVDILPIFPPLSSVNLLSLPLIYSLAYQYFKTWKSFLTAALIATAIICFVIEPLLAWGEFYQLLKWKYYYSYPLYLATAISVRALISKINTITARNQKPESKKQLRR